MKYNSAYSYLLDLVISKHHYGSRLLFVDDSGEAAYGYVTKVKGPIVTLKPSERSTEMIQRQRRFLSFLERAENVNIDDYVLVCPSVPESCDDNERNIGHFILDGCEEDRFQNLSVLKVNSVCADFVYGDDKNGSQLKVPSRNVYKIPQDWPWILVFHSISDYEQKMEETEAEDNTVKIEQFNPKPCDPGDGMPEEVESVKKASADSPMITDNEEPHGSPSGSLDSNKNFLSLSPDVTTDISNNGSNVKDECVAVHRG